MASLARCNRLGATSLASMLREQSSTKTRVLAEQMADLRLLAPLRPRQGEPHPGHGEDEQRLLEGAAGGAVPSG